jgi:predicted enzyme related to lactoylglutathione lyase
MKDHEKINYVEFPATSLSKTKEFFTTVFGWTFEDYGPDYCAFSGQGLDGGFFRSDKIASTDNGSALIVFFSNDIDSTLSKVDAAGGTIIKPIYDFPGGRRFHFCDPSGNEYAVWAEPE